MRNIISIFAICTLGFACSDNSDVTGKSPSENADVQAAGTMPAWDVDSGKLVATWCSGCHGEEGTSVNRYIPHLAGQRMTYVIEVLEGYKKGVRDNPEMRAVVTALTDKAKEDVAAYYAASSSEIEQGDELNRDTNLPLPLLKWAPACNRCHEESNFADQELHPFLDGQREDYLTYALHAYQNKFLRDSSMMHAMTELLTAQEIRDLAAYYAEREGPSHVGATPPDPSDKGNSTEQ